MKMKRIKIFAIVFIVVTAISLLATAYCLLYYFVGFNPIAPHDSTPAVPYLRILIPLTLLFLLGFLITYRSKA